MRVKNMTREQYKEKFDRLFAEYNYVMQPDEKIIQCNVKYPAYWFLSTYGYLFSVAGNKVKILRPKPRSTGKSKTGIDWYYTYQEHGKPHATKISMHKLIAEHFLVNEFIGIGMDMDDLEVHHIIPRNKFTQDQPQLCNRVSNLQIVPKKIHNKLTKLAKMQPMASLEDKIAKADAPNYQVDLTQFARNLVAILNQQENIMLYDKRNGGVKAKLIKGTNIKFLDDNITE